jgi:aspartate-semialdehyde dehydrogenase
MKVAIVGVTGLVGQMMRRVLEERSFPVTELLAVASEKSVGKQVKFRGSDIAVISPETALALQPDLVLFSAGGSTAMEWAPQFEAAGAWVIDNSSAFRMDADCALVVPEINATSIAGKRRIIANPNCSTIQMVMALYPLHKAFGIQRIVVSTYQSVSGTGANAIMQLHTERRSNCRITDNPAYPHRIDMNVIPHCDVFLENDFTKEEMKLHNETRKILDSTTIMVNATAVRVPVSGGHSESIHVVFEKPFDIAMVRSMLAEMPGVEVVDDPANNQYPMPLDAEGKDTVFVGRIRKDFTQENALNLWVVADNLRKGAATNAVQIAQYLLAQGLLPAN